MRSLLAILGFLLVIISSFFTFMDSPIRGEVAGFGFKVGAMLIGLFGGFAWVRGSNQGLRVLGLSGLGLCSLLILYLTFIDTDFFRLVDENRQYAEIMRFSAQFLPANRGLDPAFEVSTPTVTVLNRLTSVLYFMGGGGWLFVIGSLFMLAGYKKSGSSPTLKWTVISFTILFALPVTLLLKGLIAQTLQEQGDRKIALGQYRDAIAQYETAQKVDSQLLQSEQIHLNLGEAFYHLGQFSHPNAQFYWAERQTHNITMASAMPSYQIASQAASPPLQGIILKRIALEKVKMGLLEYKNKNTDHAIHFWEEAFSSDPQQFEAVYLLSKAYFDQGRYDQSISLNRFILSQSKDPVLNANLYANIGDSYWKLNDFAKARSAYEKSKRLDVHDNFRALQDLGGT